MAINNPKSNGAQISSTVTDVEVAADTRDSRGAFVEKDAVYKLVEIDSTGWALICPDDNAMCHYVDPDSLQEAAKRCSL